MRVLLCSLLFLLFSIPVYAEVPARPDVNPHVIDYSDVLDEAAEEEIRSFIEQIEEETTNQILVMTIDTIGELEPFEFGMEVIRQWGIGQEGVNNGLFIYATTGQGAGENDVWIATGQGLSGQFPDGKIGRMIDAYMIPSLLEEDYSTAFVSIVDEIGYEMMGVIDDADPAEREQEDYWDYEEEEQSTFGKWFVDTFFDVIFLGSAIACLWIIVWIVEKFGKGGGGGGSSSSDDGSSSGSYDSSSYDSSSSDSGYGGGDSDGGGSGRNF